MTARHSCAGANPQGPILTETWTPACAGETGFAGETEFAGVTGFVRETEFVGETGSAGVNYHAICSRLRLKRHSQDQ